MPEFRSVILCRGNSFVKSTFVAMSVIDNHTKDLQASNFAKVSIKLGKAARSKRQLFDIFSKPTVKVRSITIFLFTNFRNRSAAAQEQLLVNCNTPKEYFNWRRPFSSFLTSIDSGLDITVGYILSSRQDEFHRRWCCSFCTAKCISKLS